MSECVGICISVIFLIISIVFSYYASRRYMILSFQFDRLNTIINSTKFLISTIIQYKAENVGVYISYIDFCTNAETLRISQGFCESISEYEEIFKKYPDIIACIREINSIRSNLESRWPDIENFRYYWEDLGWKEPTTRSKENLETEQGKEVKKRHETLMKKYNQKEDRETLIRFHHLYCELRNIRTNFIKNNVMKSRIHKIYLWWITTDEQGRRKV